MHYFLVLTAPGARASANSQVLQEDSFALGERGVYKLVVRGPPPPEQHVLATACVLPLQAMVYIFPTPCFGGGCLPLQASALNLSRQLKRALLY